MKKVLSIILSVLVVMSALTALGLTASAAGNDIKAFYGPAYKQITGVLNKDPYGSMSYHRQEAKTYGDFEYKIVGGYACISGYHGSAAAVKIPAKIGKYTVNAVGEIAFVGKRQIRSIAFPKTVTTIGNNAFTNCTNLAAFSGAGNVTMVGKDGIDTTKWYKSQKNGVIYFGKTAVTYKGTMPAKIVIKNGTVGIANFAFLYNYTSKQKCIVIPASVKKIGAAPFGFMMERATGYRKISGYTVYAPLKSAAQAYAKQSKLTFREYPVTLLAAPMILKFNKLSNGVKISFSKTKGAYGCCVFKKIGGKWKVIGRTVKNAVIDRNVKKGVKYYYTVRCIDKNGKYISKYKATGWWYKHS